MYRECPLSPLDCVAKVLCRAVLSVNIYSPMLNGNAKCCLLLPNCPVAH